MRSGKGRGGFGTALQQSAVPFFSSSPHHAPPFPSPASRLPLPPSSEHPPLTGWIPLRSHFKRSQNRYKSAEEARTVPSAHAASDLHDAGLRIQYAAFDEDSPFRATPGRPRAQKAGCPPPGSLRISTDSGRRPRCVTPTPAPPATARPKPPPTPPTNGRASCPSAAAAPATRARAPTN